MFRKQFDKLTWSMMETGLTNLWFHQDLFIMKKKRLDWERLNPDENFTIRLPKEEDGPTKLRMQHLIGLFYLFICGNLSGLFSFIWEKLKHRCNCRIKSGNQIIKSEVDPPRDNNPWPDFGFKGYIMVREEHKFTKTVTSSKLSRGMSKNDNWS